MSLFYFVITSITIILQKQFLWNCQQNNKKKILQNNEIVTTFNLL